MNTTLIIRATERLYTLTKRAAVSDDRDTRRADIVARFKDMATALGKVATPKLTRDWMAVHEAVVHLHTEAVQADERRQATFAHAGSEAALVTSLHALASVLGFVLADADTAAEDAATSQPMKVVVGTDYRYVGGGSHFYTPGELYRVRSVDAEGMFVLDDDIASGAKAQHHWNLSTLQARFEPVSDDAAMAAVEGERMAAE